MYFVLLEEASALTVKFEKIEQVFATAQEMMSSIHVPPRKESHDFPGTGTCDKITF